MISSTSGMRRIHASYWGLGNLSFLGKNIKHWAKDNGYYDQYKVQCPLDFDFPDDGQEINLAGYINRYKTDISFIEASCFS